MEDEYIFYVLGDSISLLTSTHQGMQPKEAEINTQKNQEAVF